MSQLSELDEIKPEYIDAKLEALSIITTELLSILTPEQRETLIQSIAIHRPEIGSPVTKNAERVRYQLSLLLPLSEKLTKNSD